MNYLKAIGNYRKEGGIRENKVNFAKAIERIAEIGYHEEMNPEIFKIYDAIQSLAAALEFKYKFDE